MEKSIVLSVKSIYNLKNLKHNIFVTLLLSSIFDKYESEDEKIFKEDESIEILQILGLINM